MMFLEKFHISSNNSKMLIDNNYKLILVITSINTTLTTMNITESLLKIPECQQLVTV